MRLGLVSAFALAVSLAGSAQAQIYTVSGEFNLGLSYPLTIGPGSDFYWLTTTPPPDPDFGGQIILQDPYGFQAVFIPRGQGTALPSLGAIIGFESKAMGYDLVFTLIGSNFTNIPAELIPIGSPTGDGFSGEVTLTPAVSCFFRKTQILTPKGEVAIEDLSIGDYVVTIDGKSLPIKWIGRQKFETDGLNWPSSILPVKISKGALDDQIPHRDLYVSASHCLYVDGVLIPAMHLVNGCSIAREMPEWAKDIELFHIELDTHEVIFAEGAPAETLLVHSSRDSFDNFDSYQRTYGSEIASHMKPYAPIATYNGGVSEVDALIRRAMSIVVDVRNPIQVAYDKIADRSLESAELIESRGDTIKINGLI